MNTIDMRPKATESEDEEVKAPVAGEKEEGDEDEVIAAPVEAPEEDETEEDADESEGTEEVTEDDGDGEGEGAEPPDAGKKEKKEPTDEVVVSALEQTKKQLLEEISTLRGERRNVRAGKAEEPLVVDKALLEGVSEADITLIEKVLKAKGYVQKDELSTMTYKEKIEVHKDAWLKDHPEYLPENDPDDTKWNALNSTVSNFFKAPAKAEDIKTVLDLAHGKISPAKAAATIPVKPKATTEAAREKVQASSKGGGVAGGKSSQTSKPKTEGLNRSMFSGYSDEELEEMGL
jgi:hypothetical protein